MQYIVGIVLIGAMAGVFYIPFANKDEKQHQQSEQYVEQEVEQRITEQELPNLEKVIVRVRGQGRVARASRLLLRRIEKNPEVIRTTIAASQHYGIPIDILLAHWFQESSMGLSGEHGKFRALTQVVSKQRQISERHRWRAFKQNERDLRAICRHCGYSCKTIKGSSTGALGPMQFQPSTWKLIAIDASGDGKACPTNLNDAFYGAAAYIKSRYKQHTTWDGAMLGYAGGNVPKNRSYVRRSRLIRSHFCRIIRQTTDKNLPCSMEPTSLLASN